MTLVSLTTFEQSMKTVIGELVYAVDTVVERYNDLERKHDKLESTVDILASRVLAIEDRTGHDH